MISLRTSSLFIAVMRENIECLAVRKVYEALLRPGAQRSLFYPGQRRRYRDFGALD